MAREFLDPFIVAGIAAWVLITFVARTYYIPSGSMLPTLQIHDVLLVDKFEYRFRAPTKATSSSFRRPFRRPTTSSSGSIGRPGDTLARRRRHASTSTARRSQSRTSRKGPQYELRNPRTTASTSATAQAGSASIRAKRTSRRARMGRARIAFRRTATSCSEITATTPRTRTSGDSRKMPAVSRAVRGPAKPPASPAAPFSFFGRPRKPRFCDRLSEVGVRGPLLAMAIGREPGFAAGAARDPRRGLLRPPAASRRSLDGAPYPLRRIRPDQHVRVSARRPATRRDRRLSA